MAVNKQAYQQLSGEFFKKDVSLIAVSKTKSIAQIKELYDLGHRDFGENYAQEMVTKQTELPQDIRWHFIGHLQRNKVKNIISFVQLIQSVDSLKLLKEINKQAQKSGRVVDCLLQVHIAAEETKFGFDENEMQELFSNNFHEIQQLKSVRVMGLMGMASFTENMALVREEFQLLKDIFDKLRTKDYRLTILSMGMSSDYNVAIEEGSNMVRIGSLIFGEREKKV